MNADANSSSDLLVPPQGWATYPRNKQHMVGNLYGPNTLGEYWRAVSCDYNDRLDSSHVGFVIVPKKALS